MRSIAVIFALVGGLAFAGIEFEREAQLEVKKHLFDPYSAVFTTVWLKADAMCGTVNAKNRFGAYVGALPFYYGRLKDGSKGLLMSTVENDDTPWQQVMVNATVQALCYPEK